MSSSYEFVHALVLVDAEGDRFLAISPCGSMDPKDIVFLKNGTICAIEECIHINRLSAEFQLLEKMMKLSEIAAVYAFIWEKQEADNGKVPGNP